MLGITVYFSFYAEFISASVNTEIDLKLILFQKYSQKKNENLN